MSSCNFSFGKEVGLAAALLLLASPVLAGDRVRSTSPAPTPSKATPAPVVYRGQPVSVSIVVAPPTRTEKDGLTVRLRGPDGQVRRFPVEGGWQSIQTARPIVLRPGQSITLRWVAR